MSEANPIERIVKTACSCGQEMFIEQDAYKTCRTDRKRVFYSRDENDGLCAFRCRSCGKPVSETVPGAECVAAKAF